MTSGAHSRHRARRTARADLRAAITAARSGDFQFACRSCGYLHDSDMIAEQARLSHVVLADVIDHRLTRRQRRRLAIAVGWALLADP